MAFTSAQQQMYNQLIAAGASVSAATNAVNQMPGAAPAPTSTAPAPYEDFTKLTAQQRTQYDQAISSGTSGQAAYQQVTSGGSASTTNSYGDAPIGYINGMPLYQDKSGGYYALNGTRKTWSDNLANLESQFGGTLSSSATPQSAGGIGYDPAWQKYGIDQSTWSSLSPTQQGVIAAAMGAANTLYASTGSKVDLNTALARAASDPTIVNKYADALRMDTQQFSQNLNQIKTASALNMQQLQTQFENDRLDLAKTMAGAGEAYSGFRGRAQDQLSQSESGIVTSSLSQLQNQLDQASSAFTQKYGSAAGLASPASASLIDPFLASNVSLSGQTTTGDISNHLYTGTVPAGITGSQDVSKQQDINALASQYVQLGAVPNVIQP